ncbi:MAG: PDDEXK nuclease domain-containing protein [Terracidiphilus sp.]|jgi:predicted nuclease of restriction endonuclease-like (RecB) superfamily
MDKSLQPPAGYPELLQELKTRIHAAQVRAALAVNRELVLLYWSIGREILDRQQAEGWGGKIIDRLARDLQNEFPGVEGYSARSLKYMRALAAAWPEESIVQQLIAQLPWGHNLRVLDRIKDRPTREWYLRAALEYGWSQNVLVLQISSRLHEREGKALTNFQRTLPPPGSDLAEQILKDPYNFDFLTVAEDAHEREIERGLLLHLRDLLLELGRGFSFVGSQVPLAVGEETFYIDLLFYHLRLHAYIVIELKTGKFKPEWAGKLNFYLSAVDDLMRTALDSPTIGLLLCESHNSPVVEYALRDIGKPIGVSTYRVTRELPSPVRDELPTVEDLEAVVVKLRKEMKQQRDREET